MSETEELIALRAEFPSWESWGFGVKWRPAEPEERWLFAQCGALSLIAADADGLRTAIREAGG